MPGAVSDSIARAAEDEVLTIADGLPRAEVEQRARQAFESANEIRARYRSWMDAGKRSGAVRRARIWAEILQHMDATGEPEFCGCICDDIPPAVVRAVWATWDWLAGLARWLNVAAYVRAFRDVLGAGPVDFYQRPETDQA
jgi:hypothetical protein